MCSRDREGTANGSVTLSRVSILVGFICALSYFGAFVGTGWVYTKEPYRLTNLNLYTSVTFKIGLWRACHSFKRINSTITVPSSGCAMISYTNWSQLAIHPPALRPDMESTINVIGRIRWCAVFVGSGFILILIGFVCSVAGHFYKDNKTLVASAMYTLSGLSLAAGLFVFVCVLTDSFSIHPNISEEQQSWQESWDTTRKTYHDYKYGWCFLVAGTLCVFVEMVAVLCMAVHHRRCQTIAQIIKNILPVEEQQKPTTTADTSYFSSGDVNYIEKLDPCKVDTKAKSNDDTFATSETPPDICSTFLNVEYAEDAARSCDVTEHLDICSLRTKKSNFATLNTRNYRCLKYPSSNVNRRYSTMSGCSSIQGSALDGPSSSSSSSSTRPNNKCHQSATSCIQSTMPRVRNTAGGISTKYATVDRQCSKKNETLAEVQTLEGDNFGL